MVQQEENQKSMIADRDLKTENIGTFAMSHIARPSAMQGERPSCEHYGKLGHEEGMCFELVRYPPGWTIRGGKASRGRNRGGRGDGQSNARHG